MRFRVRGLLSALAIALGLCVVVGANAHAGIGAR